LNFIRISSMRIWVKRSSSWWTQLGRSFSRS
jgi:hypothetical protein